MPAVMSIDLPLLLLVHNHGELNGIPYRWGAKPRGIPDTSKIRGSDCSGWTQYLLWRCAVNVPAGSVEQREYAAATGYEYLIHPGNNSNPAAIASMLYRIAEDTAGLYWLFIDPVPGAHAGHTWFVHQAETLECYGGRGVGSRPWWERVLRMEVRHAFRIL